MDFNTKFPTWAEGTEPSDEIKESGFQPGYKPPASFFNWFWHLMMSGGAELQEKLSLAGEEIETLKKGSGVAAHASTHKEGGTDPISPYDIGAIDAMIGLVNGTTYTFDTALTQGEYNVQAEDAAGAPYAGMLYGKLIVTLNDGKTKEDTNWIWQEFLPASMSKQRCWRMKINTGDWTDWFVYYDTGHMPSFEELGGVVPIAKGGTGTTSASKAANNLGVYSLLTGTTIPESSDLNSYTTPGNYCCGQSSTAGTLTNCPTYNAFTMRVLYANGSHYYIGQELVDYATGVRYYRLYSESSDKWGEWQKDYSTANKPTPADIGAAVASEHNIRTYTNLSQLGLSDGATLSQVANALPGSSFLRIYVLTDTNANLAPVATNGWLEVSRPSANHAIFQYTTSSKERYVASVLSIGTASESVSEWSKIASTLTITGTGYTTMWAQNTTTGYWVGNVSGSGLLTTDDPIVDIVLGDDPDANALYEEFWAGVKRVRIVTNNQAEFHVETPPSVAFTVRYKVVR